MALFTRSRHADDQVDDGDYVEPADEGYGDMDADNPPRIAPPRGLIDAPVDDDEYDEDTSTDSPELTAQMADTVQFQEAVGRGYYFPQVEEFCNQAARSLAWHERNARKLQAALDARDVELGQLRVTNRRQSATLSILSTTGDLVVGPDGEPVTADGRLTELQNELTAATRQVQELTEGAQVLNRQLAEANARISEQQGEVEELHGKVTVAEEAQRAAENRARMFESALENARRAGLVSGEETESASPVVGPGPVDDGAAADDVEDDGLGDFADDVEDVEDVEDAHPESGPTENDRSEVTQDEDGSVVDVDAGLHAGEAEAGEDAASESSDPLPVPEGSVDGAADAPAPEVEPVAVDLVEDASDGPVPDAASPSGGDDAGNADDAVNAVEEPPAGRFAAWAAAAAQEPVVDGDPRPEAAQERVVRPGDPLDLGGRDIDDYAPELARRDDE